MITSTNGKTFLKNEEGVKLTVYKDSAGYLTVGCGHKVLPEDNLKLGDTITQAQSDAFLAKDLKTAESGVNARCLSGYSFTQNQFDALVSIAYNGGNGVLNTSDMKNLLNYNTMYVQYTGSIPQSFSQIVANAFTYGLAQNLAARRNREADLFCKGTRYGHAVIK